MDREPMVKMMYPDIPENSTMEHFALGGAYDEQFQLMPYVVGLLLGCLGIYFCTTERREKRYSFMHGFVAFGSFIGLCGQWVYGEAGDVSWPFGLAKVTAHMGLLILLYTIDPDFHLLAQVHFLSHLYYTFAFPYFFGLALPLEALLTLFCLFKQRQRISRPHKMYGYPREAKDVSCTDSVAFVSIALISTSFCSWVAGEMLHFGPTFVAFSKICSLMCFWGFGVVGMYFRAADEKEEPTLGWFLGVLPYVTATKEKYY